MIPEVGLIVACYTLVRLVSISLNQEEKSITKVLAVLAFFATIFLAWTIVTTSS